MRHDVTAEDRWRFRVLGAADVAELQRFFANNPEYFVNVNGEPPGPGEAQRELDDVPPPGMPYREMLLLGFMDQDDDALVGMATIVGDFIAAHVWHVGLFIVASALHGSGTAHPLYRRLERWIVGRAPRGSGSASSSGTAEPNASGSAAATSRCANAGRFEWVASQPAARDGQAARRRQRG